MKRILAALGVWGCLSCAREARATVAITSTGDASALADALKLQGGSAITITSATYSGASAAAGTYTDGPLGIHDGALFTSGDALLALPPDTGGSSGRSNGLSGDPLCDALIPGFRSFDATKLTIVFDLAAGFDGISFQSIFGSEEFPEYVGSAYNDVYGVYLNGVQIAFDGGGNPITIDGPFFSSGSVVAAPATETQYDGSTSRLTTQAPLAGGSTGNVLEIVVCDAGDRILDSGVFIAGLTGCVGQSCTGTVPCEMVDDDQDGSSSCDDCDDTKATVHPGGAEVCDELDNDCDGIIDGENVCCTDTDGDGSCDGHDNCAYVPNADQSDVDGDALGDACDACPYDAQNDADGDGICGDVDECPDTPLLDVPTGGLTVDRWADVDGDGFFDTKSPHGNGVGKSYTIVDTGGCNCTQIAEALGLGEGQVRHGCSLRAMDTWVAMVRAR